MFPLLILLTSCDGCRPQLPSSTDPPPEQDTDRPDDSAEETGDSGPPPRCETEEIEPNDLPDSQQTIPMEAWACGSFDRAYDIDWFQFTTVESGWVEVSVEAAARGTSANPQFLLTGPDDSALALDAYLTTDPRVVFPSAAVGDYQITLNDTYLAGNEQYGWWMIASITKAPVVWDVSEVEPNDAMTTAEELAVNQTVFGYVGRAGDYDWYHIVTADEAATITFTVEAFAKGSLADLTLQLYEPDGTVIRVDRQGEIDYDRDPWFEQRVVGATEWYLQVQTADDRGSSFHWYTLNITSTPSGA